MQAKGRGFLRLVVDDGVLKEDREIVRQSQSGEGVQLELFGKADSILFAATRALRFSRVRVLLEVHAIRHILDLREAPFLNFEGSTRERFFRLLKGYGIDYISLLSVVSGDAAPSIEKMLDDGRNGGLVDILLKCIGCGPTLVFIQQDRDHDPAVKRLFELLNKNDISYSEILQ